MKKFKTTFTHGVITQISKQYYNVALFINDKQVYASTLTSLDAAEMINKYNNIKLINL
jgi:hypothetical protein